LERSDLKGNDLFEYSFPMVFQGLNAQLTFESDDFVFVIYSQG